MTSEMLYLKTKREKVSRCNICSRDTALSWDHVPPKGGIELSPVEQETVFQRLVLKPDEHHKYFESQNGVKFRTICTRCNNLLGHSYDPILNDFALSIGRMLRTALTIPDVVQVKTRPNRLVRSIFGHLLASKGHIEDTVPDRLMRQVVLDPALDIPQELQVQYWIHPFSNIVIIRDVVMPAVRGVFNESAMFSVLKYFPVGYIVTTLRSYERLHNLTMLCSREIDQEVDVPIFLRDVRQSDWPEVIDPGNLMVGGQSIMSAVHAQPRQRGAGGTAPANKAL